MVQGVAGAIVWVLKMSGGPGSIPFLVLCLVLGLLILRLWPTRRRLGRAWLAFVAVTYLVMALPVVATTLAGQLPRPAIPPAAPGQVDILVVFDGDNRRGRMRVAQQMFSQKAPEQVWVLGERWLVDALAASGLSEGRLFHDTRTATTRDQMARVIELMAEHRAATVGVIVSRLQAARVAALAARHRPPPAIIAAPIDHEPPTSGIAAFVPRYIALRVTRDALYEHAALAYYRWRGWIASDG